MEEGKDIKQTVVDKAMQEIEKIANLPEQLANYIVAIVEELKEKCDEDLCALVCDTEIRLWLKRIEDSIKVKKQNKIRKILEEREKDFGGDEKLEELVNGIWDVKDIANDVMIFLRVVGAFKAKALLRNGCDRDEMNEQLGLIDAFLETVQAEFEEEANEMCEPLRGMLIKKLKEVHYQGAKSKRFSSSYRETYEGR